MADKNLSDLVISIFGILLSLFFFFKGGRAIWTGRTEDRSVGEMHELIGYVYKSSHPVDFWADVIFHFLMGTLSLSSCLWMFCDWWTKN